MEVRPCPAPPHPLRLLLLLRCAGGACGGACMVLIPCMPVRRHALTRPQAITAFLWGPLCPLLVWGIFNAKPWRYALMLVISMGQIYGDVLYYGTCYLEGARACVLLLVLLLPACLLFCDACEWCRPGGCACAAAFWLVCFALLNLSGSGA